MLVSTRDEGMPDGFARTKAFEAVGTAIRRHVVAERMRLLRLHRLQLQATISRVSPLTIDLAAHGGFSIADVARRLKVPAGWPPTRTSSSIGAMSSAGLKRWWHDGGRDRSGVTMRDADDPRGGLYFTPRGDVLEVVSLLRGATLSTDGPLALLSIADTLPRSVLAGAIGKAVDGVVSHPTLDGRGYLVEDAFDNDVGRGVIFTFRPGTVSLEMPWREELTDLMRGIHSKSARCPHEDKHGANAAVSFDPGCLDA